MCALTVTDSGFRFDGFPGDIYRSFIQGLYRGLAFMILGFQVLTRRCAGHRGVI